MATHSRVLAWRIPGTGEAGGLPATGSHRVGHDWSDLAAAAAGLDCSAPAPSSCSDCCAGVSLRSWAPGPGVGRHCAWAQQWHLGLGAPRLWDPPDQRLCLRPLHQQVSPRNGIFSFFGGGGGGDFLLKPFHNNPWEEICFSSPVYTCICFHVYILYT